MNYLGHFGLREPPFSITPDTSFFYPCRSTQEALNTLLIALENGEGIIKITGEVGTGKTLLCRKFLAMLDASWISAYVPNPSFEPRTLRRVEEARPRPLAHEGLGPDALFIEFVAEVDVLDREAVARHAVRFHSPHRGDPRTGQHGQRPGAPQNQPPRHAHFGTSRYFSVL